MFRVVRLEVKSSAARVDHDTSQHRIVLLDAGGGRHAVDPVGQAAWEAAHPRAMPSVLHAGDAAAEELVFDLPSRAPVAGVPRRA